MLLEREAELGLLHEVVAALSTAGGKVVLVRGEAGIGKSALVAELVRTCPAEVRVLRGTCDDLFIPMPLAPFWDVAREEPGLQPSLGQGDRARFMQAVMDVLSGAQPTLLVIEDTHWADEATLDAIRFAGRRIGRTRAAVVLTYRVTARSMTTTHCVRSSVTWPWRMSCGSGSWA
jgi:predicted ATPase